MNIKITEEQLNIDSIETKLLLDIREELKYLNIQINLLRLEISELGIGPKPKEEIPIEGITEKVISMIIEEPKNKGVNKDEPRRGKEKGIKSNR